MASVKEEGTRGKRLSYVSAGSAQPIWVGKEQPI